jgi:tRNA dimethylallyltransferase
VPHHLIDLVELAESFDAARFVTTARAVEADLLRCGRVPVYCGGTGLYFKALLAGLGEAPPADASLRAELEATALEKLLAELGRRDPATFARIDRQNPRRVVRAVEVIRLTGRPFSEQQSSWQPGGDSTGRLIAFTREPADLRRRIDARVDEMFAAGLVDETRRLLDQGLDRNRTAMQAIGYRQVVEHLRGERPLRETTALVKSRTWQFARRQLTWLRHQLSPRWIELSAGSRPADEAGDLERRACATGSS